MLQLGLAVRKGKGAAPNPTHGSGSLRPPWQALTLINPMACETAEMIVLEDF